MTFKSAAVLFIPLRFDGAYLRPPKPPDREPDPPDLACWNRSLCCAPRCLFCDSCCRPFICDEESAPDLLKLLPDADCGCLKFCALCCAEDEVGLSTGAQLPFLFVCQPDPVFL